MHVIVKKSSKAKRIQIRIRNGSVILTVPKKGSIDKALEFLNFHKKSLLETLSKRHQLNFKHNDIISILGKEYLIIHQECGLDIVLNDNNLLIHSPEINLDERMEKFLMNILKDRITLLSVYLCEKLGVSFNKISIKKTVSRWGSCSSKGNLSFCWKLIFVSEDILQYVVAHEVCHLKEMNHSKSFWYLVNVLCPDYKKAKEWLKKDGRFII